NEINEASQRLLQAKSLKEKRIEYEVLSHPMVSYLKRFADKKYYIFACADDLEVWVQDKKEPIVDPYCANPCPVLSPCGIILGEIPSLEKS
ncbi:MAG: hypothetical protein ACOY3D_03440, partial [Candidatus Omnitrophota bacterium]